jgi:hypothetical protein
MSCVKKDLDLALHCVCCCCVACHEGGVVDSLFVAVAITYVKRNPHRRAFKGCIECLRARLRAVVWALASELMLLGNADELMRYL